MICDVLNAISDIFFPPLSIPTFLLSALGPVSVHGRGGAPAAACADQAVPHLAADVASRRLGAAQGGPARRRLRPPRGHGQPSARSVSDSSSPIRVMIKV